MKRINLLYQLLILVFSFQIFIPILSAQSNDRCENALLIPVNKTIDDCVFTEGDTRGTEDASQVQGPFVCSGTWYADDVWFKFETLDEIPIFGIEVQTLFDPINNPNDLDAVGMAIYKGCNPEEVPFYCFSNEDGTEINLVLQPECMETNSTYFVRIWSGGGAFTNSGTFRLCAVEVEAPPLDSRTIYWEEDFEDGIDDWSTTGISAEEHIWTWMEDGILPNSFGGFQTLNTFQSACNAGIAFHAFDYQVQIGIPPMGPYTQLESQIVSPPIDLSNTECVNLVFDENMLGLNGSDISALGTFIDFSIDGGETWIGGFDPSPATENTFNTIYTRTRSFPLFGAEGNADVRLRFTFKGDFYHWLIDNIKIVEGFKNDMQAQSNFYSIASYSSMPVDQIDELGFLIDLLNYGCSDQEEVVLNCTCIDDGTGQVVFEESLDYNSIMSDSLAENIPIPSRWIPERGLATQYTCTYTVSAAVEDENPENNSRSFTFKTIDEMQFRKEEGATGFISPNDNAGVFWDESEPKTWEIGNTFFVPNESTLMNSIYRFTNIDFQCANPQDLAGESVRAWLYSFEDLDQNGLLDKNNSDEIQRLAFGVYEFTGFEEPNEILSVELEDFTDGTGLDLKANTHYIASIEFSTQNSERRFIINSSNEFDYTATMFLSRDILEDPTKARYTHALGINKESTLRLTPTNDITSTNFGDNLVPVIRLNYDVFVSNQNVIDHVNFEVSPNPTANQIKLNLDLKTIASEISIQLMNVNGQILIEKRLYDTKEINDTFDLLDMPDGLYFINVSTANGKQTSKFVLNK